MPETPDAPHTSTSRRIHPRKSKVSTAYRSPSGLARFLSSPLGPPMSPQRFQISEFRPGQEVFPTRCSARCSLALFKYRLPAKRSGELSHQRALEATAGRIVSSARLRGDGRKNCRMLTLVSRLLLFHLRTTRKSLCISAP